MLNRAILLAGIFGFVLMIGIFWFIAHLIETKQLGWAEMSSVFITILIVVGWVCIPEWLNLKRENEIREKDEESMRKHTLRKLDSFKPTQEQHMDHLKFMAEKQNPPKQSKPIETYKEINTYLSDRNVSMPYTIQGIQNVQAREIE